LTVLHGETVRLHDDVELEVGGLQGLNKIPLDAVVTKASY
jgi:hypothetical protein